LCNISSRICSSLLLSLGSVKWPSNFSHLILRKLGHIAVHLFNDSCVINSNCSILWHNINNALSTVASCKAMMMIVLMSEATFDASVVTSHLARCSSHSVCEVGVDCVLSLLVGSKSSIKFSSGSIPDAFVGLFDRLNWSIVRSSECSLLSWCHVFISGLAAGGGNATFHSSVIMWVHIWSQKIVDTSGGSVLIASIFDSHSIKELNFEIGPVGPCSSKIDIFLSSVSSIGMNQVVCRLSVISIGGVIVSVVPGLNVVPCICGGSSVECNGGCGCASEQSHKYASLHLFRYLKRFF
jgi:hypothetical protein